MNGRKTFKHSLTRQPYKLNSNLTEVVKILTRDVQPDPAVIRKAYQALDVNRIGRSAFSRTPQSEDCDYSDRNRFNKRPGRKPFRN